MPTITSLTYTPSAPIPGGRYTVKVSYDTGYWWAEHTMMKIQNGAGEVLWEDAVGGSPGSNSASVQLTLPQKCGDEYPISISVGRGDQYVAAGMGSLTIVPAKRTTELTVVSSDNTPNPGSSVGISGKVRVDYQYADAIRVIASDSRGWTWENTYTRVGDAGVPFSITYPVTEDAAAQVVTLSFDVIGTGANGEELTLRTQYVTLTVNQVYTCPYCQQRFYGEADRSTHISEKHGFECQYCASRFATQAELNSHIAAAHPTPEEYYCEQCGAGPFSTPYALQQHADQHTKFKCDICGTEFTTEALLNTHVSEVHTQSYTCPVCLAEYSSPAELQSHVSAAHGKQYVCAKCGALFDSQSGLDGHMNVAHPTESGIDWQKYLPYVAVGVVALAATAGVVMMRRSSHATAKF